jgi:hypothetical protein
MSAALNAFFQRQTPPLKRDAFAPGDLNQVIMSKFVHICNMPERRPTAIERPRYTSHPGRGSEIGPINGLGAIFAHDFNVTSANTHLLTFTDDDYRNGDDLSDLIGDTELQRLAVEVWDPRTKQHLPSILSAWQNARFKREVATDVTRHVRDLSLLSKHPQLMAYEVREAIYRCSSRWGGEAAQFGAIKAHCIIEALIAMSERQVDLTLLDTSAGWGDRALGAATVGAITNYIGFDPNVSMHASYRQIAALAQRARADLGMPALSMTFVPRGFPLGEDTNIAPFAADIVFTSPPYWDKEVYSRDAAQSTSQYKTFDEWFDGFFCAMLDYSLAHLRPGGVMAIHISDIARMTIVERMLRWCERDRRGDFAGVLMLGSGRNTTKPVWLWKRV